MNEITNFTVRSLMDISGFIEGGIMVRYVCEWKHLFLSSKLWLEFHFLCLSVANLLFEILGGDLSNKIIYFIMRSFTSKVDL